MFARTNSNFFFQYYLDIRSAHGSCTICASRIKRSIPCIVQMRHFSSSLCLSLRSGQTATFQLVNVPDWRYWNLLFSKGFYTVKISAYFLPFRKNNFLPVSSSLSSKLLCHDRHQVRQNNYVVGLSSWGHYFTNSEVVVLGSTMEMERKTNHWKSNVTRFPSTSCGSSEHDYVVRTTIWSYVPPRQHFYLTKL